MGNPAYRRYLESVVVPKAERVAMRKAYLELRKTFGFWDYIDMSWRKHQLKRCYYCGTRLYSKPMHVYEGLAKADWHVDHKLPIYRGGTNEFSNFCLACPPCNILKSGDMLERTWIPGMSKKKLAAKNAAGKHYF